MNSRTGQAARCSGKASSPMTGPCKPSAVRAPGTGPEEQDVRTREHHWRPRTAPRCSRGSASERPGLCDVVAFWAPIPYCGHLLCPICPCPTLNHQQGPLGWGGAGRAGLGKEGIIITPSAGLETELSWAFLSAPQALR